MTVKEKPDKIELYLNGESVSFDEIVAVKQILKHEK